MEAIMFFGYLASLYMVLFFFDRFFKSCMHYPYDAFLKNTGLSVDLFRVRWYTTGFNRFIFRLKGRGVISQLMSKAYLIGVFAALCLLPIGIILVFSTLFDGHRSESAEKINVVRTHPKLDILLPGVNLPVNEIGFYILTFLLSTIVHECGHAFAATLEDVPVVGFGVQFYFCIPMAYTELSLEHLSALKWSKKLRILCGGVWHNLVFGFICYLLYSTVGIVSSPLFSFNKNVIIVDVDPNSPLRSNGNRGLEIGHIVTHINDCEVYNDTSWYKCLLKALRNRAGFCVSSDFIRLNDESIDISHGSIADGLIQCCDERNHKQCCFEYVDDLSNDAPVEIPQHICLDVRQTIEQSYSFCENDNCERGFCLRPLLRNSTTIMNIKRTSREGRKILKDVIYIGHPADVSRSIRVSPFVPKQGYVTSYFADAYVLCLKYIIVFNVGLALTNTIPCFWFDGYHILSTVINSGLISLLNNRRKKDFATLFVTGVGTISFCCAILKVLWLNVRNIGV